MKKLILSAALLCAAVTFSQAQDRPQREGMRNPEDMAKRQVERLDKELKLTTVLKDSLNKWFLASGKKQQELFKDEKESREVKMEKWKAMREDQQKKIKAILTPEQRTKYEEMAKNRPEQRQRRVQN
ncbi:hypothetical protein VJ786_00150 [Sphingobacterium sp. PU5-4]|uniref:DUF4890 domain-containing protein n=1 Tax=Sphingobacterium tenebrionis TaxID=3111775 RepID=A0ABU8I1K5_9SPHI